MRADAEREQLREAGYKVAAPGADGPGNEAWQQATAALDRLHAKMGRK